MVVVDLDAGAALIASLDDGRVAGSGSLDGDGLVLRAVNLVPSIGRLMQWLVSWLHGVVRTMIRPNIACFQRNRFAMCESINPCPLVFGVAFTPGTNTLDI